MIGTKQWLKDVFDGGINEIHACSLARAALLVEEIRAVILSKTGFHCSAGISHNKVCKGLLFSGSSIIISTRLVNVSSQIFFYHVFSLENILLYLACRQVKLLNFMM